MDDGFEVWLGHIGKERPMRHDLRRAVNQAGGSRLSKGQAKRRFTGTRTGRGVAAGRMLAGVPRHGGASARRVVVKARFVKLAGRGIKGASAHLAYLQRDGTTREGERGTLSALTATTPTARPSSNAGRGIATSSASLSPLRTASNMPT